MRLEPYSSEPSTLFVSTPPSLDSETLTRETVAKMRRWIVLRSSHPIVVYCARTIAAGLRGRPDRRQVATAVFNWMRRSLGFVHDEPMLQRLGYPEAAELLIEPARLLTLAHPAGDCDDFTMTAGALLGAFQIPCEIVTLKADPNEPARWSHVFLDAILENGAHFPMDTSHGPYAGWEAPEYYDRRGWGVIVPERPKELNGYYARGGLGETTPWWQTALNKSIDIVGRRLQQPGQYYQTSEGVVARQVPYAVPGQYPGTGFNVGVSPGGMGVGTIAAVAAVGLGAALLLGRRR